MHASNSINQTIWVIRFHPLAIAISTILTIGAAIGLYIVFSHYVLHQHGKIPFIAWHWCLPILITLMLINIKMTIKLGEFTYTWRIGPCNLHKPCILKVGAIEWHNIGNKSKTYRLGYRSPSFEYLPIVTLNRKGASMVSSSLSRFRYPT